MNMIVAVLVIAGLLAGGGATVNAARDDLPDEPLYSLKLWSEDISLQFQDEPVLKVERLMQLADLRVQEMIRLTDSGRTVPDQVRQRLQEHIQLSLQICASMDDTDLEPALLQVRERLQQQDRDMEQLQIHAQQDAQPVLARTRAMLRQRLQLVDEGLLNQEMFRNSIRNGFRLGPEGTVTPTGQNGADPRNGQPTAVPMGTGMDPGGPNNGPGGTSTGPGQPDTGPGGPNPDAGGPHLSATPSSTGGGGGHGEDGAGGGSNGSGTGGGDPGGNGAGGGGSGGSGSGGNKP